MYQGRKLFSSHFTFIFYVCLNLHVFLTTVQSIHKNLGAQLKCIPQKYIPQKHISQVKVLQKYCIWLSQRKIAGRFYPVGKKLQGASILQGKKLQDARRSEGYYIKMLHKEFLLKIIGQACLAVAFKGNSHTSLSLAKSGMVRQSKNRRSTQYF